MEKASEHIKAAFDRLKEIPVTDSDVDRMFLARQQLNRAFTLAAQAEEQLGAMQAHITQLEGQLHPTHPAQEVVQDG